MGLRAVNYLYAALFAILGLIPSGLFAATVIVDPDSIGMGTVAYSEKTLANGTSRLTLKATAEDGFAFHGWSVADNEVVAWPADLRCPGSLTVTVASNATVSASFASCAEDFLSFDIVNLFPEELNCGEDISEELSVFSESFPTITFRNLPHGLSFDDRTLTVFGQPDTPGLYRVEAEAVNESGFTFSSYCVVRVLDLEDARVSGIYTEIPVGEYFYSEIGNDDISDIFSFSESPTSVELSGTVPGLAWSNNWSLVFGTPTQVGDYTLKVKASFPTGRVETATMTLSVVGADPDEYGLDMDVLNDLKVGELLDETCQLGADGSEFGIVGVTGLPAGLSASFRYEDGVRYCFVSGMVRESGFFTVTVRVKDSRDEMDRTVEVVQTIMVTDEPDVYLSAKSVDPESGTVSGGGAVSPAEDVRLVAIPKTGFVFAGWYDSDGEPLVLQDGVDYRTSAVVLPAGSEFEFLEPVAYFVSRDDDIAPDLFELENSEFSFAPGEPFALEFSVDSTSLPTLTFKGLPNGVSCVGTETGEFILKYDPDEAVAASKRYTVVVTAANASGKRSSATFRITVETQSDDRVNVYDDYGEFSPWEEIDPIDLSEAVDFARGETLSVSGLPKGLSYNSKANAKKAIDAYTITGIPTVPGEYTLTFTAKVVSSEKTNSQGKVSYKYETAKATAFLTVLAYPELMIDIDEDAAAAGCKVTGAGNYKSGTKLSLRATAAKGWVFAGWEGLENVEGLAALNPKPTYATEEDDVWAQAVFLPVSEDGLSISSPVLTEAGFAAEWPLKVELGESDATLVADLIKTVSWPTVKIDGLPGGVKFSSSTFRLSGKPTKSGVYHLTVTAKSVGGYSFVRVLDVAVLNADGTLPEEKELSNAAKIDFTPLKGLTTGVYCPTGAVVLTIGPKPGTGSPVKKVSVSGLPAGLISANDLRDDGAAVVVSGTPTKPGRVTISISVTYADGKTLKSQAAVVIEDGGSFYLFVATDNADAGTVSGEGVYAAGATVKLVAKAKSKQVFAGWCSSEGSDELQLFVPIRDMDGIDPRTASVAFPFRPADFTGGYTLVGAFVPSAEDVTSSIELESECWKIDPAEPSIFTFAVDSLSVPKVTVSGLPKGVKVDAVRGRMTYTPLATTVPGVYSATVSSKNATQKKATSRIFAIKVANHVSEAILGLDPATDAYQLSVGTVLDPALIVPKVDVGWKLSVNGLPSGITFKNGVISGVPSKAGNYTVTFTATTGTGKNMKTETATITMCVTALPTTISGTFTGVLTDQENIVRGSVSVTATTAGKVTVVVQTAAKKLSFVSKSWDAFTDGLATVKITTKDDSSCMLSVAATDDWQSWQASGELLLTNGDFPLLFKAQRNPYGQKDGFADARAAAAELVGVRKVGGLSVKVTAKGTVTISGKYESAKVSGSTVLQWDEVGAIARYVKFLNKNDAKCFVFRFDEDGVILQVVPN